MRVGFTERFQQFLRPLFVVLFLTGFPLLLADIALRYLLDLKRETDEYARFAELEQCLLRLQPLGDPEKFIKSYISRLVQKAQRSPTPVPGLLKALVNAETVHPGLFTFTLFDGDGAAVPGLRKTTSRLVSERLLGAMKEFYFDSNPRKLDQLLEGQPGLFFTYFGGNVEFALKEGTGWIQTSANPEKSWFYYHIDREFSLFAHVNRGGFTPMVGLKPYLQKPLAEGVRIHLVNLDTREAFGRLEVRERPDLDLVINRFEHEPKSRFRLGNRLWEVLVIDPAFRLVASAPDDIEKRLARFSRTFRFVAAGVFLVCLIFITSVFNRSHGPGISISAKMVVLFLLSTGLPLLILVFTVLGYLNERDRRSIQEAMEKSAETLRDFDEKFPSIGRYCQRKMATFMKGVSLHTDFGMRKFRMEMADFLEKFGVYNNILVSSMSKEIVFSPCPGNTEESHFRNLSVELIRGVFAAVRGEERQYTGLLRTGMVSGLFPQKAIDQYVNEFVGGFGRLINFRVGERDRFFLMELLRNEAGQADYIIAISWKKSDLAGLYVKLFIPFKPLEDGTELVGVDSRPFFRPRKVRETGKERSRLDFQAFHRIVPSRQLTPEIFEFTRNLFKTNRLSQRTVMYKGKPCLLTGIQAKMVDGFYFLALKPLQPLHDELASLKTRFTVFGLLNIGFTFLLGVLMAKQFLTPVRELSYGIMAAREKRFNYRVRIGDRDELGDLSEMFNTMLEGLHEMNIARAVQEELLPQETLSCGEYRIFGLSKPAMELGGDFFDYRRLEGGKILLMIGDVVGHGVPAALGMSMAKVMSTHLARKGTPPESFLADLNLALFETLKFKMSMTLDFLWIDPESHQSVLFNCGHPFPYIFRRNGSIEFLEASGMCLGVRPKVTARPTSIQIERGERILFYTDALIESIAEMDGHEFSRDYFEIFRNFLKTLPDLPIEDACRYILENHPSLRGGHPQPDDFTVLMLERRT